MEAPRRSRVVIADDHRLVAEMCRSFIDPEFEVVGIAHDGRSLVRLAIEQKPQAIIADIAMPLLNGLDAGEQIKQTIPDVKIVYLTMNMSAEIAAEAFRRGASGYLPKSTAAAELITALRTVLRGEFYLSPVITRDTVQLLLHRDKARSDEPRITMRQREVLQLLAEGMSMKEVAYTLKLKPGTVAFHKYRIMSTLGLKNNAELLQYAIRQHLIAA